MSKKADITPNLSHSVVQKMTKSNDPSDLSPAFTWVRLSSVGAIAARASTWVAENVHENDSPCTTGLRRWDHIRRGIINAAVSGEHPWLTTPDPGASFVFAIGGMPVRYCRPEGDEGSGVPPKYAAQLPSERKAQAELALGPNGAEVSDVMYRLLVKPNPDGATVAFAALNLDGEVEHEWPIAFDLDLDLGGESDGGDPSTVAPITVAPIVTPKAAVTLPPLAIQTVAEVHAQQQQRENEQLEQEARVKAQREAEDNKLDIKGVS